MYLDGLIIRNERVRRLYENPNIIPRLRDIWFHVEPPLSEGCAKFFKLEYSSEYREGNKIIKVEFFWSCCLCFKLEVL